MFRNQLPQRMRLTSLTSPGTTVSCRSMQRLSTRSLWLTLLRTVHPDEGKTAGKWVNAHGAHPHSKRLLLRTFKERNSCPTLFFLPFMKCFPLAAAAYKRNRLVAVAIDCAAVTMPTGGVFFSLFIMSCFRIFVFINHVLHSPTTLP